MVLLKLFSLYQHLRQDKRGDPLKELFIAPIDRDAICSLLLPGTPPRKQPNRHRDQTDSDKNSQGCLNCQNVVAGGKGFEPLSQAPEACALSWLGIDEKLAFPHTRPRFRPASLISNGMISSILKIVLYVKGL